MVAGKKCSFGFVGDCREPFHGCVNFLVTIVIAGSQRSMGDFGWFAGFVAECHVNVRKQCRIERFIMTSFHSVQNLSLLFGEVHIDKPLINLSDSVLQSSVDPQFASFDAERQGRLNFERDFDFVKLHQCSERGNDDATGTCHSNRARNVALISDREIAIVN